MKKPFRSTIVLLSFNKKTISVNNGYIESYRNEKTISVNHSDVHKKNGIKSTERESKTLYIKNVYLDLIVMKKQITVLGCNYS